MRTMWCLYCTRDEHAACDARRESENMECGCPCIADEQIAANDAQHAAWIASGSPVAAPKPTIAELEAILAAPAGSFRIEIQPNGEVRSVPADPAVGGRMSLVVSDAFRAEMHSLIREHLKQPDLTPTQCERALLSSNNVFVANANDAGWTCSQCARHIPFDSKMRIPVKRGVVCGDDCLYRWHIENPLVPETK